MKKTVVMMSLFMVTFVAILTTIGMNMKETNDYKILEEKLVSSAKDYIEMENLSIGQGGYYDLTIKQLSDKNYFSKYDIKDETCDGYVRVKKDNNEYSYNAYLTCDKYSTK